MSAATETKSYLPEGLPIPVPENDGLSAPYWSGLQEGKVRVQRCNHCGGWQWAPEWICHRCHSFDMGWSEIEPEGVIYTWTRVWHPTHRVLNDHGRYVVVVVEIPGAGGIRMVGNLLGDPGLEVTVGGRVRGVFEHHPDASPPYSLLQWERI